MRILFIQPCCIGDTVLATAALLALRAAYPQAHITWAVGGWSRKAIEYHPAVNEILDTGNAALPVKTWADFWRFVGQLRKGRYEMVISFVRSPLMSLAVLFSGIPKRVGLDSNGRGFGYNLRLPVDPNEAKHEAQIYLDLVGRLGIKTEGYEVNLPVLETAKKEVEAMLHQRAIEKYFVLNPAGGSNPGMQLDSKRYPIEKLAEVGSWLALEMGATPILIGGPDDAELVMTLQEKLTSESTVYIGKLSFPQIGALAAGAILYVGNDTGLTHLAAASGAKTAMIMGPSDPKRYAPFSKNSIALWKATKLNAGGVAAADSSTWDWDRDGISVNDMLHQLRQFAYAR